MGFRIVQAGVAVAVVLSALGLAAPAHAGATFFTGSDSGSLTASDASFDTSPLVKGLQTFTFGPVANPSTVTVPGNSLTVGGATFSGNVAAPTQTLFLVDRQTADFPALVGFPGTFLSSQTLTGTADVITVTLNSPIDAIGFNFGNHNRNKNVYDFVFNTAGGSFTQDVTFNGINDPRFFLGIVSTTPIISVTITDAINATGDTANTDIDLTGFSTADAVPTVPEPATGALLGAGLLWLGVMRRRRHRAQ